MQRPQQDLAVIGEPCARLPAMSTDTKWIIGTGVAVMASVVGSAVAVIGVVVTQALVTQERPLSAEWIILTPWLSLAGPMVLVLTALIAWRQHRKIAAQKGALDFLLKYEVDNADWRKTRRTVRMIFENKEKLDKILNPESDSDWNDRFMVGAFLSRYEFIAVAIQCKAMDGKIYRTHNGPAYIRTWSRAETYIAKRRRASGAFTEYCNFERLAKKWRGDGCGSSS